MLKYALLIYYIFYIGAAFIWPSYRVWRQTGHNPFVLDSGDDIHSFVGNVFKLTLAVTAVTLIITVQTQVLLEEAYLQEKHGESYIEYCRRVPRWI